MEAFEYGKILKEYIEKLKIRLAAENRISIHNHNIEVTLDITKEEEEIVRAAFSALSSEESFYVFTVRGVKYLSGFIDGAYFKER